MLFPHLDEVQQVLQRNPAKPFDAKVSVALGSAFVGYRNDVFDYGSFNSDFPVLPQLEAIVLQHTKTERINLAARVDLLGASVLTDVGRFSLGLSQRADVKISLPEEFSNYLFFGDSYVQGRQLEVSDLKAEASIFIELALRYQTPMRDDGWSFGGSLKILGGQTNGILSDALGKTIAFNATDTFLVEAQGRVRNSGLAAFAADSMLAVEQLIRKPNNFGLGVDMGIHYQFDDTWAFGFSILDVGFIRWNRRVYDGTFGAKFRSVGFPGIVSASADLDELLDSLGSLIIDEPFDDTEAPTDYGQPYTRSLLPSVLATVNAQVNDAFVVGMTYSYDVDKLGGQHSIGVNAKVNAGDYVQALAGYSFAGTKHAGLGVGLVLALGPLQIYATADNVLELVDREKLNGVAVNAGANLVFPMVWFGGSTNANGRKLRSKAVKCYKF